MFDSWLSIGMAIVNKEAFKNHGSGSWSKSGTQNPGSESSPGLPLKSNGMFLRPHPTPQKMSSKSVNTFFSNLVDRQTDKETDRQTDRQTDCGGRVVILLFCPSYFLMETGLYWYLCQISLFADVDWALLLFSTVCCRCTAERRLCLSIRSHPRR